MSFDALVKSDAAIFVDPQSMPGVESVVYKPRNAASETLNVNVFREDSVYQDGILVPITSIFVAAATIRGDWTPRDGDVVMLAKQKGGEAIERTVRPNGIQGDAGGWTLKLS